MRINKFFRVFTAIGIAAVGLALLHRAVFDEASSRGRYCRSNALANHPGPASAEFELDQFCWPSRIHLEAGKRYRITLDTPGDWFDRTLRADVGGVMTMPLMHILATPMKRWWFEEYFQPIVRIGETGNDEYVLRPNDLLPSRSSVRPLVQPAIVGSHFDKLTEAQATLLMQADPVPPARRRLVSDFTARTTGQLYLYVNDAVLMWPGSVDRFYQNNYGRATVSVHHIQQDGSTDPLSRR
jgi:hypothetical protein